MTSSLQRTVTAVQRVGKVFGVSEAALNDRHIPRVLQLRMILRDAAYLLVDWPKFILKAQTSYGKFVQYRRQMRRHGKINPEDFKDIDMNEMRQLLDTHAMMRGPLMRLDFRVFNYFYVLAMLSVLWTGSMLQGKMDEAMDKTGGSVADRHKMFADDYEEDQNDHRRR